MVKELIKKWVLPPGFFILLRRIKCFFFTKKQKMHNHDDFILLKNKEIKNIHEGKRCFVIGNGSSINKVDLTLLKNEFVFVVNDFIVHPDFEKINPAFYSEIEPISIIANYPKTHQYFVDTYYKRINDKITKTDSIMFLNIQSKEYIENTNLYQGKKIYYLQGKGSLFDSPVLEDDISLPNTFMDGVIFSALNTCAYMGFKTIYIVGCDADHILQKREAHFYENKEKTSLEGVSNKELAYNLYLHLTKMERIKKHFFKKNITIINAGIGGMIDVFDRINFNELFPGVK